MIKISNKNHFAWKFNNQNIEFCLQKLEEQLWLLKNVYVSRREILVILNLVHCHDFFEAIDFVNEAWHFFTIVQNDIFCHRFGFLFLKVSIVMKPTWLELFFTKKWAWNMFQTANTGKKYVWKDESLMKTCLKRLFSDENVFLVAVFRSY